MKNLAADLKNNKFEKLYLFFGTQDYLISLYENNIRNKALEGSDISLNSDVFSGKNASVEDIFGAIETLPFFSQYRVVTVKDSGLFAPGRKNDSALALEKIKDLPESGILLFIEEKVDKRSSLYKQAQKCGKSVEFDTPPEKELITWIIREGKKENIEIDKPAALHMCRTIGVDMGLILTEIKKLASFAGENLAVTIKDIDEICSKSLEAKVFDLVTYLTSKNTQKALEIYQNLLTMKESPIMILSLIARQFRIMLHCVENEGGSGAELAKLIGVPPFTISGYFSQSRNYSQDTLVQALKDTLEADIGIKTGQITDKLAVEMLIIKYSS